MECIKLRLQDGAMFFPLDEIRSAKGTTSAGLPAIAFTGRSTGGLQFIKLYREKEERDRILQAIAEQTDKTERREAAERILADRLQTFKARQLVWDAKQGEKPAKKPFNNQFNQFEQNEYTDEELDEIINSSVS